MNSNIPAVIESVTKELNELKVKIKRLSAAIKDELEISPYHRMLMERQKEVMDMYGFYLKKRLDDLR